MDSVPQSEAFRFSPRPHSAQEIPWRAWSVETFAEAQARNRPILLCITAAWSQWSHLMDERAYSDDTVQYLIKTDFVPVRVDAAERPDVDRRYNRGGWPTTAFLTPEGELMAGATYIPVQEMRDFLVELAEEYRKNRDSIREKLGALEQKRREAEASERAVDGVLTPRNPRRIGRLYHGRVRPRERRPRRRPQIYPYGGAGLCAGVVPTNTRLRSGCPGQALPRHYGVEQPLRARGRCVFPLCQRRPMGKP